MAGIVCIDRDTLYSLRKCSSDLDLTYNNFHFRHLATLGMEEQSQPNNDGEKSMPLQLLTLVHPHRGSVYGATVVRLKNPTEFRIGSSYCKLLYIVDYMCGQCFTLEEIIRIRLMARLRQSVLKKTNSQPEGLPQWSRDLARLDII